MATADHGNAAVQRTDMKKKWHDSSEAKLYDLKVYVCQNILQIRIFRLRGNLLVASSFEVSLEMGLFYIMALI